jgi:aryl sulfotransferase
MSKPGAWPKKTRELENHHLDSTIWNDFVFRDDDIVIATYAKSGTTWMQQIVVQLIFGGSEDTDLHDKSLWIDGRIRPKDERLAALAALTHRRAIKSHAPADALVYSPRAKYIYVARDGRDVAWSLHNHHLHANDYFYERINNTPGLVGPPLERPPASVVAYYNTWIERDGYPFWSWADHVRGWWAVRDLPNLLLVHYADLKADLPGELRRIAAFLDIPVAEGQWPAILDHCSFAYMKAHSTEMTSGSGKQFEGGGQSFINKGTNGRWRDMLSADDCRRYEAWARDRLGAACADWAANGGGDHGHS